ncbi:MAG: hypothetical protein KG075_07495 [Alphaproteobacteria bacterium]|nr:hypothetical protein [Alphaproteobacteria bacterium]
MKKNFHLIAYNLVLGVFAALGVTLAPETANEYAEALVTIGIALFGLGNAWLIKRRNAAQAIVVAQGDNAAPVKTGLPPSASVLLMALLLLPLLSLSACNTFKGQIETDAQRVYAIDTDFQHATRLALGYVESPTADPLVKATIKKLWLAADNALAEAQTAVRAGTDPKLPALISLASDAVNELVAYLLSRGLADESPPPRVPLTVASLHVIGEIRHAYP